MILQCRNAQYNNTTQCITSYHMIIHDISTYHTTQHLIMSDYIISCYMTWHDMTWYGWLRSTMTMRRKKQYRVEAFDCAAWLQPHPFSLTPFLPISLTSFPTSSPPLSLSSPDPPFHPPLSLFLSSLYLSFPLPRHLQSFLLCERRRSKIMPSTSVHCIAFNCCSEERK